MQLRLDKCSSKIFIFEDFNNEFYKDYNILKEKGYAQTNKDFIKNDKKEIQMYIDYLLPIIIFIMILVLISLICITSISIIKDKKLFDIYKLIGCSKKELTIIILDYFLIIFFISFMINTFVELYLIDQGIIVSKESYIRALSLLLIVIVFSMFISLTITNKYIGVKSYDKN